MIQGTVDEPLLVVLGRVRTTAANQGWIHVSGGLPQAPQQPMFFRRGFGSFAPAGGMQVRLVPLDPNRTEVAVTVLRGIAVVDGYDADVLLRALATPAG